MAQPQLHKGPATHPVGPIPGPETALPDAMGRNPGHGGHPGHPPARAAADDIDEPPCADNIVEFKPLDAERERERSAAIDLRVPPVPPVRAAAAAACASAAAPVRNYSLNLR